jgi:hypothetical protein
MSQQLTEEHKWVGMETCIQFLQQYHEEGEALLQQTVTGNETWVHLYEPAIKCQSTEWKRTSLPPGPKNSKARLLLAK